MSGRVRGTLAIGAVLLAGVTLTARMTGFGSADPAPIPTAGGGDDAAIAQAEQITVYRTPG